MKRILKPVIITLVLLALLTGGAIYLLTRTEDETNEFVSHRQHEQSDQEDSHAYRFETDSLATELSRSGENKNVLNFDSNSPFTVTNSQVSRDRLNRLIGRMDPSFDQPIIAYNPFGTMPDSYYFYFKTPSKCMIKYTITVADEKVIDHIRYVNNGEVGNLTTEHEFAVGGLIPGMINYIMLEMVDENGSSRETNTFRAIVPEAKMPNKLPYERGKSDLQLQNGMFFVFPKQDPEIYIYDNNGMLRGRVATEGAHGRRIYQTESRIIYQVSPMRVIRVNRLGEIDGVALTGDQGNILDFSYDGYDNVYALVQKDGRYHLIRCSMQKNESKDIFTFDKKVIPTSVSSVSGGDIYVSTSSPAGIVRIDGLTSMKPRVGLVIGLKDDWKKTDVKKKVSDPTATKKPKEDEEAAKDKKDEEEAEEPEDEEAATGSAAGADQSTVKEPAIVGWDMSDTILDLVEDESDGKIDTLTFGVVSNRLVHAIKCQIDRKQKKATVLFDKEVEFDGQITVQTGARDSWVIANNSRGRYEERDEVFKVTREFTFDLATDAVWKRSLEGVCFFG